MDTQVLIVGAGPTGLTLAVDLGLRGVRCTLIEQKEAPQFLPKMERCNARTMEIYRRMGIAEKVRAAGLPAQLPDGRVHRALAGRAAAPASALSVGRGGEGRRSPRRNDGTLPLEPYQLISQYTLEPLLKSIAEPLPTVIGALRLRVPVVHAGRARRHGARCRTSDGATSQITARYLVGCDGGVEPGAQAARHRAARRGQHPAAAPGALSLRRRSSSASRSARAGTITSPMTARRSSSCRIRPGISRCTRWSSTMPTWRPCSSRPSPCRSKYEMLYVGEWKQNLLLADALRRGPRVPRRRRRAPRDPDRRARHEHRRRRRHRSRRGSSRRRCRAGAGRICCPPTRSSGARSANATWRPRAMPRSAGASGAPPTGRTSATTRRRALRRAPISRASPTSSSARATR